jgi:NAD(P)-dependent dehydrogenase (short-subunit alcohol dehydrogenase family)
LPGIGAAIAKAFVEAGCRCIAITDIVAAKLEETREELINISPDVVVLTATGDIADERFVNAFINSVIAETGRIDYAVCIHVSQITLFVFPLKRSAAYATFSGELCWNSGQQPVFNEHFTARI